MSRSREVLSLFKRLHRTASSVFGTDLRAVSAAKARITADFKKNKNVSSENSIDELIKLGIDCDAVLKEQVIIIYLIT